ncbi:MAG TPA: transposase [Dissulfurispiraceae bacterium]|nr:transposase [Dissulfurispiraceae bacterium]
MGGLPEPLGKAHTIIADSGYYSESNITECEAWGIEAYMAIDRQSRNEPIWERHRGLEPLPEQADAVARMKHRLRTTAGRAVYAIRKTTVEPAFGVIKAVMGFRQFMLRGCAAANGEWNLACLAWNIKRMHVLKV